MEVARCTIALTKSSAPRELNATHMMVHLKIENKYMQILIIRKKLKNYIVSGGFRASIDIFLNSWELFSFYFRFITHWKWWSVFNNFSKIDSQHYLEKKSQNQKKNCIKAAFDEKVKYFHWFLELYQVIIFQTDLKTSWWLHITYYGFNWSWQFVILEYVKIFFHAIWISS